jgi:circadian clock protein KaiC
MSEQLTVEPLRRMATGIRGFEQISMGGLVEGRTTLLVGTSGSGKTLFAVELLYRSIQERREPAVFVTFEEKPSDILRNVLKLDWDLATLVEEKKLVLLDASMERSLVAEAGRYDLSGIISQIADAVKEVGAKVVVLDSLGALFYQFDNPGLLRREILRIADTLQEMGVTALITAERLEEYGPISRFGIEEFVSDGVIVLRHQLTEEKVRRTIQIYKLRGDRHHTTRTSFHSPSSGRESAFCRSRRPSSRRHRLSTGLVSATRRSTRWPAGDSSGTR